MSANPLTPYRIGGSLQWPLTSEQLHEIDDDVENLYRVLNQGVASGVTAATYGSTTAIPSLTIADTGLVTSATTIATSALTGLDAGGITSGLLALARGGTHADLSATGGAKNYLKQAGVGADVTVGTIPASDIVSGAALTKVDDTNVTLTLGGTPASALLTAASLTLGWTGTLAAARLNANVVQAITNDTNVTGSIATQTLTLGWTGTLAVARGGIGVGTLASNGVLYGQGTSAVLALAVNSTATNKFLRQVSSGAPSWQQPAVADLSDGTNVALLNAANVFTAGQTLSQNSGNKTVTIGGSPGANDAALLSFLASNSAVNWQIRTNFAVAGGMEILPSTAGGGSTFSTAAITLGSTGLIGLGAAPDASFRVTVGGNSATVGPGFLFTDSAASPENYAIYINGSKNLAFRDNTAGVDRATIFKSGGVSIGNTTDPGATNLSVTGGVTGATLTSLGGIALGNTSSILLGLTTNPLVSLGTPTITASVGGTGPTITGKDCAFAVVMNSATSVTVTFSTTFGNAPRIGVSYDTAATANKAIATTTTTCTITGAGVNVTVYCVVLGW